MKLLNTFANGTKDYKLPSGNILRKFKTGDSVEYDKLGDIVREIGRN